MTARDPRPVDEMMSEQERRDWRGRFGEVYDGRARCSDIVDLALTFHGFSRSGAAVLLSDDGVQAHARYAPLSLVDGSEASGVWSMPEWLAREKGWL